MAYKDIENWRQILESEDAEKKAYTEACDRRAQEKAELDEKEFWEQDQDEIDPKTMGIGECGLYEDDPELAEVEDMDEEIDFSEYEIESDSNELNEADLREPLTRVSTALGRPASTASLDDQDSVTLAEAIRELAKALKSKNSINEANESTDAGWLAWVGGENAIKDWNEKDRAASRKLFDALVAKGSVDGTTGQMKEINKGGYHKATDTDMNKDADTSALALDSAKKFYRRWLDDPDFREKNALKDQDGATVMKPANPEKEKSAGKVIAGTDPNSEGAKLFKSYFDLMTPEDQAEFESFARKEQQTFTTKHYAPHKFDTLNKKGDLHGKDGDDEDNVNPLAQHGLDQTFNADNADADMFDDPENGEEFYSQFDSNHVTISHEEIAKNVKQITDIYKQWAAKKGLSQEELNKELQNDRKFQQIINTVLMHQKLRNDIQDRELEFMFLALDPDQLATLRKELEADANGDRYELQFIDYIFRFGKDRKLTAKDFAFMHGIGGDQKGNSGNLTQYNDRHIGMLVAALGQYFEIDEQETSELLRTCASQNQTKKDKENNIDPRRLSRHLICKITQELYDSFWRPGMPKVKVPQSPSISLDDPPKLQGKDWDDVKRKIAGLCYLLKIKLKPAELRQVALEVQKVFEQKYGTMDAEGNTITTGSARVRKMVTRLNFKQNREYQQLVADVRNGKQMADDAKIRLLQLDYMRLGDSEDIALDRAQKDKENAKTDEEFTKKVNSVVQTFLAGGSKNVNKNKIKQQEA